MNKQKIKKLFSGFEGYQGLVRQAATEGAEDQNRERNAKIQLFIDLYASGMLSTKGQLFVEENQKEWGIVIDKIDGIRKIAKS